MGQGTSPRAMCAADIHGDGICINERLVRDKLGPLSHASDAGCVGGGSQGQGGIDLSCSTRGRSSRQDVCQAQGRRVRTAKSIQCKQWVQVT